MRKALNHVILCLALAVMATSALASETSSGTISASGLGGGQFLYTINLTNTSTDGSPIGTFWYSWTPGNDFMEIKPTNVTFPAGWSVFPTGSNNASDGNALEFVAGGGSQLNPGSTDTFTFDSTEALSQMTGPSTFDAGQGHPVEKTYFIYKTAAFADAGLQETLTTSVPEPATLGITLATITLLTRRRKR